MIIHRSSADYQLTELRSAAIAVLNTSDGIRPLPGGYGFLVPLEGEMTARKTALRPGSGTLVTLAEPLELSRARGLLLAIPGRQMDGPSGRRRPLGVRLDLRTGLGRIVADLLKSLAREGDALTIPQFDASCDHLTELLRMLTAGTARPAAPAPLAEVAGLVRRYVRAHAADPDLTGASIAQDLGWSLRQIQLALQQDGATPRGLIREEHLRLARRLLQDPAYAHLPITELAYASGFSSPSAFSTAFRHRYNTTPREIRRLATGK
ncbi:AraC family transcriptional regulator [Actinocorallia longicatena]|uniref:HTH araC/xylS-type domain-containing protein n=1 Tax=Actinocorallia longicatena TaxID=111803 RepID=A0ABP6QMR9_9ACTN